MAKRTLPTMLVPPLRTPVQEDIKKSLSSWLDESNSDCGFSSSQVVQDLDRIASLRKSLVEAGNDYDKALQVLPYYQEYHAALVECEARGFPSHETASSLQYLSFPWQATTTGTALPAGGEAQIHSHLIWERANVLWNIASLLSYQASIQDKRDLNGWNQAHSQLQQASSILRYLTSIDDEEEKEGNKDDDDDNDKATSATAVENFGLVEFWKLFLLAHAQIAAYYMVLASAKPRHAVLAKLAMAAAVPMLHEAGQECCSTTSQHEMEQVQCKAWELWMLALAHYHQSCVHRQKKLVGKELARLDIAKDAIVTCQELVYQQDIDDETAIHGLKMLQGEVPKMVRTIRDRLLQLQQAGSDATEELSTARAMAEIRGEVVVKADATLPRDVLCLERPMFEDVGLQRQQQQQQQQQQEQEQEQKEEQQHPEQQETMQAENLSSGHVTPSQQAILKFQDALDNLLDEVNNHAEDEMEKVRRVLAKHGLPHSLTAYKQEHSGGGTGIPVDLWERIGALQAEDLISQLKNESLELCHEAELAIELLRLVSTQLQEDVNVDSCFRNSNPHFVGHNVVDVQQPFRTLLNHYQALLQTARGGDTILMRRLESLDTEPKYKLLQLQRSQLDRLIPSGDGDGDSTSVDTTPLARLLVAMSSLFDEREELLDKLQADANEYDIAEIVAEVDERCLASHHAYDKVVQSSLKSFDGIVHNIRANISQQEKLMESVLKENELFTAARKAGPSSANGNSHCLVMIEDAMEETEHLRKYLKEGRDFYAAVISKLEQLKREVGDASARLTIERCDYEDNARNRNRESEDARLAASLALDSPPRRHQDAANEDPEVDDAKLAHLMSMDFEPHKVVAALKKHNNNLEHALNELLS